MHDVGHSAFNGLATAITPASTLSRKHIFRPTRVTGQPAPGFVATPVVVNHVIYVGSNSGDFYAIDLRTGTVLWSKFLGFAAKATCGNARGFAATAAVGTDPVSGVATVYAPSADGYVYALQASDGTELWKHAVNVQTPGINDYFSWSSPELANGKIYVGISSECDNPLVRGGLVALDQATGDQVAVYYTVPSGSVGGSIWTSPAIAADGSILVTTGNGAQGSLVGETQSIVRLDADTLQRIDSYQVTRTTGDSDFGGSPTVFTATLQDVPTPMVGACNKDGNYYAWKLNDLSAGPVWHVKIAPASGQPDALICVSGAIWDGSNLYVAGTRTTINSVAYRGSIRKLDPATGAEVWATGLPAAVMTSPSLDGSGAITAASFDYAVTTNSAFLVDAATGAYAVVDDGGRAAASPIFADGLLVIANSKGHIYTYAPL